jgi:hypothetical protein
VAALVVTLVVARRQSRFPFLEIQRTIAVRIVLSNHVLDIFVVQVLTAQLSQTSLQFFLAYRLVVIRIHRIKYVDRSQPQAHHRI